MRRVQCLLVQSRLCHTGFDRTKLLNDALTFVPVHGWSVRSLSLACEQQGLSPAFHGVFARGPVELVEHFFTESNKKMSEVCSPLDLASLPIPDRLHTVIQTRLKCLEPVITAWPQAIALQALPQNLPYTLKNKATLVDEICFLSGDRSTSIDWYINRAAVAGLYSLCEVYMITDTSKSFDDTWNFLHHHVQDLHNTHETIHQIPSTLQAFVFGLVR
eukprot:c6682_g1_i1.p1 GENE.c6682_g1_i1~~c6682_g1_i1.p1  ORF type:complete len:217 (+),score=28.56 c6682_g1_i1:26-676(+)